MDEKILDLLLRLTTCLKDAQDRSDTDSRALAELENLEQDIRSLKERVDYVNTPGHYWPPERR